MTIRSRAALPDRLACRVLVSLAMLVVVAATAGCQLRIAAAQKTRQAASQTEDGGDSGTSAAATAATADAANVPVETAAGEATDGDATDGDSGMPDEPADDFKFDLPEAPQPYADLMKSGNVEFEFYDPQKTPHEFDGETHFTFIINYRYRYRFRLIRRDGERIAIVRPGFSSLEIDCKNKIYIPRRLCDERFWDSRLVDHEFEHVRLNSDNRPQMIAEYLLKRIQHFEIPVKDDETFGPREIEALIAERVKDIRSEIRRIIQFENDYLDQLTRHGRHDLEDSEAFFGELYERPRLDKAEFKFRGEVEGLTKKDEYRETEEPSEAKTPGERSATE